MNKFNFILLFFCIFMLLLAACVTPDQLIEVSNGDIPTIASEVGPEIQSNPPTQTPIPMSTFTPIPLPTSTATPNPTATPVAISRPELENLDGFLWQNRLIVVFTDAPSLAEFETQFAAEEYAIVDRQILWFIVVDNSVTTNYTGRLSSWLASNLRDRYARLDTALEVVLIGKDGGVKNRQPFLDSSAIYGQIDQMPMRRAEMTRQSQR